MAFPSTYKFSSDSFELGDGSSTVGDWTVLAAQQVGGKDQFYGDSYATSYAAYGDAMSMSGRAIGGADYMQGGDYVNGDAGPPTGFHLVGDGVHFAGDAIDMSGLTLGGNDTLSGGTDADSEFYGDASGTMSQTAKGGADTMNAAGTFASFNHWYTTYQFVVGDAFSMIDSTRGGADTITGGVVYADGYSASAQSQQVLVGDGWNMSAGSVGGADKIYGGEVDATFFGNSSSIQYLVGDATYMSGTAVGGNDIITGGSAFGQVVFAANANVTNVIAGDGYYTTGTPKFGVDTLTGGSGGDNAQVYNYMYGDSYVWSSSLSPASAAASHDFSALGAVAASVSASGHTAITYAGDKLFGGDHASNYMYGDTSYLLQGDKGGADTLTGGAASANYMVGDSYQASGATGGADHLISGTGDDFMWGDFQNNDGTAKGGADVFVFGFNNGNDTIEDFQVGVDHIDITAFSSLRAMPHTFRALAASGMLEQIDGAVVLHLDIGNAFVEADTVTIIGVTVNQLANSFLF